MIIKILIIIIITIIVIIIIINRPSLSAWSSFGYSKTVQRRLRSDCADAQADLSLR